MSPSLKMLCVMALVTTLAACGGKDMSGQEARLDAVLTALAASGTDRATRLQAVLTDDAVWVDSSGVLAGRDAMVRRAPQTFTRKDAFAAHHNVMHAELDSAWMFAMTSEGGRFTTLVLFPAELTPVEDMPAAVADYQAAWNALRSDPRLELLNTGWGDQGHYLDPQADVTGKDALNEHIAQYQRTCVGTRIQPVSGARVMHGFVMFRWEIQAAHHPLIPGVDVGRLGDDGKLDLIAGFF